MALGFKFPSQSDHYNVQEFNDNFRKIDTKVEDLDQTDASYERRIKTLEDNISRVDTILEANINVQQNHDETLAAHNEVVNFAEHYQSKQNEIKSQLDSLEKEVTAVQIDLSAIDEISSRAQRLIDDSSETLNQISSTASEVEEQLYDTLNNINSEAEQLQSRHRDKLNEQAASIKSGIDYEAQMAINQVDSSILSVEAAIIRARNAENSLIAELNDTKNAGIATIYQAVDKAMDDFSDDATRQNNRLLSTTTSCVESLNRTIDRATDEQDNLSQAVADTQNTLRTLKAEIQTEENKVDDKLAVIRNSEQSAIDRIQTFTDEMLSGDMVATKNNNGLMPKLPDDASKVLNGKGNWSSLNYANIAGTMDATKIDGIIPLKNLPQGALDKLVNVANTAARLALTINDVQNGDIAQEDDTGVMYRIVDDTKLGSSTPEKAFKPYTAGRATYANEAGMVNGHSVNADVPQGAKFTDTTYELSSNAKAGLCPKLPTENASDSFLNGQGNWVQINRRSIINSLGFTPLDEQYLKIYSNVTLSSSGWVSKSGTNPHYEYEVEVSHKISNSPFINLLPVDDSTVIPTQNEFVEYGKIVAVTTSDNAVILHAFTKPTINLKISIQGVETA